jgi:hypothetical protein
MLFPPLKPALDKAGKQGEKQWIIKEVKLRVNENAMIPISLISPRNIRKSCINVAIILGRLFGLT